MSFLLKQTYPCLSPTSIVQVKNLLRKKPDITLGNTDIMFKLVTLYHNDSLGLVSEA